MRKNIAMWVISKTLGYGLGERPNLNPKATAIPKTTIVTNKQMRIGFIAIRACS